MVAETLDAGLRMFHACTPPLMVTLDLVLTDSPRWEETAAIIKRMKEVMPDVLVIVITGVSDVRLAKRLVEFGADGLIRKRDTNVAIQSQFLGTLRDTCDALIKQPNRYQRNISTLESLCAFISTYLKDGDAHLTLGASSPGKAE